jgi:hypothetical protein
MPFGIAFSMVFWRLGNGEAWQKFKGLIASVFTKPMREIEMRMYHLQLLHYL